MNVRLDYEISMDFGRTDLRNCQSRGKFDARADGDVRLAVRRPKSRKICEKHFFRSEIFAKKNFLASKNNFLGIVRNAFWQIFAPIRAKFET